VPLVKKIFGEVFFFFLEVRDGSSPGSPSPSSLRLLRGLLEGERDVSPPLILVNCFFSVLCVAEAPRSPRAQGATLLPFPPPPAEFAVW